MLKFKHVMWALLASLITFVAGYAFASEVINPGDYFLQVVETVGKLGGMTQLGKVSAILLLIVASAKVSFLNELIWQKLGAAQVWVAPVLGLLAGIIGLGAGDVPLTAERVIVYVSAGVGAVALHEFLDSLKAVPGIGTTYLWVIELIKSWTGGPAPQAK